MRISHFLLVAGFACYHTSKTQSLSGPESVERNNTDLSYFVSNTGTGEIVKLLPDGTVQSFASGFSAGPHGLELIGDSLYACDGGVIRIVSRTSGTIINTVAIGGSFLNGITHKGNNLYFTDFSAKKIYRMNTLNNQFNVFVNGLSKTPNGIVYDDLNDRLVFVCWGSSAPVYEVNLTDSSTTLLTTTAIGNCDGIAMNCLGEFYISCWSPTSNVYKFNSTFSSSVSLGLSGISQPADIYFDRENDTLAIPNSGNNTVTKSFQSACILGHAEINTNFNVSVFPNPTANTLTLNLPESSAYTFLLLNSNGKQVMHGPIQNNSILDLSTYPAGLYLLQVRNSMGYISHQPILKMNE